MSGAAGIGLFVLTMIVMIMVHEFGHLTAAKKFGIKVEEYFIGFGPKLFSRKRGETEYGIKAFLLGGYVKIAGMNPWQTVPESDLPRTYGAKPRWQRAIVLVAGSATHPFLAVVILWLALVLVGIPLTTTTLEVVNEEVAISEDEKVAAPAHEAGLQPGDKVLEVDGKPVDDWSTFQNAVRASAGEPVTIKVERGGETREFTVTPVEVEAQTGAGETTKIGLVGVTPRVVNDPVAPHIAVVDSVQITGQMIGASVVGIGKIFSPSGISQIFKAIGGEGARGPDEPVGLVGAGRIASQEAQSGRFANLAFLLAGIVVFVGVINLVPLPPLDGGHLLVLVIEKIRGRPIDMRRVVQVGVLVLGLLLVLVFSILYLDIVRPIQNPFQ